LPAAVAAANDESCFLSPLTGIRSPTMGVASLAVSGKARKEFQRACHEGSDKKLVNAEEHLRKAVRADAKFAAAWVLLGQVFKAEQKPEDARNACSQALTADPNYLPASLSSPTSAHFSRDGKRCSASPAMP